MIYKTSQPFFSINSLQNFSGMTDSMTSIMFCEWFLYQIIHPPIKLLFLHSTSMFRKLGSISPSYVYLFLWNSSLHSLSLQNRPSNFSSLIYEDVNLQRNEMYVSISDSDQTNAFNILQFFADYCIEFIQQCTSKTYTFDISLLDNDAKDVVLS